MGTITKYICKYFVQIYHRAFILILTSSLRGHALHIFQGQELFELIGRIVLDEVASVGESYQGVGQVLTEDHHQVARVPDQPPQHTLALNIENFNFEILKMLELNI